MTNEAYDSTISIVDEWSTSLYNTAYMIAQLRLDRRGELLRVGSVAPPPLSTHRVDKTGEFVLPTHRACAGKTNPNRHELRI